MKKYNTYSKYVIRKPLFSYDILFNKDGTKNIDDVVKNLIQDDSFTTSIYWSSPILYDMILSYRNGTLKEDKIPKLVHTLKKYAIRSSTRCTPYGTMAGLAYHDIKNTRSEKGFVRKARIDMDFLAEIKSHIEKNDVIKSKLRYKVNNTLYSIPNQYRYYELVRTENNEKFQLSSLEITEYLDRISKIDCFVHYEDIKNLFSADFDDHEVNNFIDELIDIKFLVSELQFSPTSNNLENIKMVLQNLVSEDLIEAKEYLNILEATEQCIFRIEETPISYLPKYNIEALKEKINKISIDKKHFFHVDLLHSSESSFVLNEKLLRDINSVISLLQTLNTSIYKENDLDVFKKYYKIKYENREVLLTEVLDLEFGIGFPVESQIGNFQGSSLIEGLGKKKINDKKQLESFDLDYLLEWLERENSKVIHLDNFNFEKDNSFVKNTSVCVVGIPFENQFFIQNVGISGGTSILGRFAILDDQIKDLCNEIHNKEKKFYSDDIIAEVLYMPENRASNIVIRPQFTDYEIPIFVENKIDAKGILLKDILISVENNEIILRSKKLNKRIIPKLSNAHNFYNSDCIIYKFLCAVQSQNQTDINFKINYSVLKKRFIPRIVYKNIILHRACWIMYKSDIEGIKRAKNPLVGLKEFFQKWNVEKYIVLVQGDNELFLDTSNDSYLELLLDELKNNTLLQFSECLLPTVGKGNYNEQIVLPLESSENMLNRRFDSKVEFSIQRSFAPGSEWLYLKLYCNSNISDSLLSEIKPILDELTAKNYIKKVFFIRYTDPHYHIRLRIHLNGNNLYSKVLNSLYELLNPHFQRETIWNIQIDSYQREIERYLPEFMESSEEAFYYDSLLILEFIDNEYFLENENIRLFAAVKNVDSWLSLFGLSLQEKLDFCKSMVSNFSIEFSLELKSHINMRYRILKEELYDFFVNDIFKKEFYKRDSYIRNIKLSKEILPSYIHMSINRWFSSEQRALEFMTYSFASKYFSRILSQSK